MIEGLRRADCSGLELHWSLDYPPETVRLGVLNARGRRVAVQMARADKPGWCCGETCKRLRIATTMDGAVFTHGGESRLDLEFAANNWAQHLLDWLARIHEYEADPAGYLRRAMEGHES